MRFDQTFIAIRERSSMELLDLTLHVIRYHFRAVAVLLFIGVLPWLAIDWGLTYWMVTLDHYNEFAVYFYWVMAFLVISQAQVGTTFVTHYLGQAMFVGKPSIRDTIRSVFKTSMFFLWVHLAIRFVVPTLLCVLLINAANGDANIAVVAVLLPSTLALSLLIRMLRPFVSEMLLLERTPLRAKKNTTIDFKTRSKSLHQSAAGDLFTRFLLSAFISVPLMYLIYSALTWIDTILDLQANTERNLNFLYWPIALWMTAGVIAVFRFLGYIDTRIRQEGWAVELRMRAEALLLTSGK